MATANNNLLRHIAWPYTLGAVILVALGGCATPQAHPTVNAQHKEPPEERGTAIRTTESFRLHHAEIREHLNHIDAMATGLASQPPAEQRSTMLRVVTFLKSHIEPHAADEERVLYPVVERQAGQGSKITSVPIYEHRIVERSIAALEREAARPAPDAAVFSRDALHLMGLLYAHFEDEEEVLLPILDKTMTPEQFKRDVADRMAP